MGSYEIDFDEDLLGKRDNQDSQGRRLGDLEEEEDRAYAKALKSHLWNCHGFNSSMLLELRPITTGDLEAIHYQFHRKEMYVKAHSHSSMEYPIDLGVDEKLSGLAPDWIVDAVVKFRELGI